jgi:hypothetical protein
MAQREFLSGFTFGDKVMIDSDTSITATVLGFAFYPHQNMTLCGWFHNGASVEAWFGDFRLTLMGPAK